MRNPIFVGWQNLEMFAVPSKDRYRNYVPVPAFWRIREAHRILCVLLLPRVAYYFGTFGDIAQRYDYIL